MISSCDIGRANSPVTRPWHMTITRSLMPIISGISDEIIRIPMPFLGQVAHQGVDFSLGAHVDAAGRLIHDQQLRLSAQPLGEHDLLLVATAQVADSLRNAGRGNRKGVDVMVGNLALRFCVDGPHNARYPFENGQADVGLDVHAEHQAMLFAIFGHPADALVDGIAGVINFTGLPLMRMLPPVV